MKGSVSTRKLLVVLLLVSALCFATSTQLEVTTQVKGILARINGGTGVNSTATFPTSGTVTVSVASGTATFATTAITTGSQSAAASVSGTLTNILATDSVAWTYKTTPTAATDARLIVNPVVGAGSLSFTRTNPTASSITPTAIVINWQVTR